MPHVSQGRYHCLRFIQTDLYAPANLSHFPDLCALAVGANRIPFWVDTFCWEAEGTLLRTPASCVLSGSRGWACRCQKALDTPSQETPLLLASRHLFGHTRPLQEPDHPFQSHTRRAPARLRHARFGFDAAVPVLAQEWHRARGVAESHFLFWYFAEYYTSCGYKSYISKSPKSKGMIWGI